jgi:GNAT superfamily N-acetyltransferase
MKSFLVRSSSESDALWIKSTLENSWGSVDIVSHGKKTDASQLPAFIAVMDENLVGLITYHIEGASCEIVTLDSTVEGKGIGTALINAVIDAAKKVGCKRLWLITTNDNMYALAFYQKRGFRLSALFLNSMEEARKLKPEIPFIGNDGIPLRDEIELEITF